MNPDVVSPLDFIPFKAGFSVGRAIVGRLLARFVAREAVVEAAQFATKAAAREYLGKMGLEEIQAAAVNRTIGRATATSTIGIAEGEAGSVVVSISRPGRNGYQVVESTIRRDGSKSVVQKGINAAGQLEHYDPKTP